MSTNPTLKPVTDESFHALVRENLDPVVVYFTGSWCQPCKAFGPILEAYAARNSHDVGFLKADMDEASVIATELGIRNLPSLVLFMDGMVRDIHTGTMKSDEIRLWIQENI